MNGYIVAYALRDNSIENHFTDTDKYEVFIDDGTNSGKKANKRFQELCKGGKSKEFPELTEVYSVNLCKIIDSTEATYLNIPI